jgi:hypothetical protein
MSRPAVKWGALKRTLERAGYDITGRGGERMVKGPPGAGGRRNVVMIGHKSCSKAGSQVLPVYLNKLKNDLGADLSELGW